MRGKWAKMLQKVSKRQKSKPKSISKFCKLKCFLLLGSQNARKMGQNALKGLKTTEIDAKGNFEILQTQLLDFSSRNARKTV